MPPPFSLSILVRGTLALVLALAAAGPGPVGTPAWAVSDGLDVGPVEPVRAVPNVSSAVWPESVYNPKPLPDDMIVPLPCGGALAFRPAATPANSTRTELVGPFARSGEAAERHLLIGKYEVTVRQYRAASAQGTGGCPGDEGLKDRAQERAQVGVSRIDAVNFAAQLSRWLHANAERIPPCDGAVRPCLPRVDGKPAFVRLPLEQEWEYAVRGGAVVSDDVFAQPRYPMPEGLERHAWYNRNSDGEIAPVGQRLPNPLGLYDLYGNAWEFMNEAYQSEQYPGQIGGDILRGGGIHSPEDELRADRRVEVQPYDAAGEVGTADTGFRVVLAAPIVTSVTKRPVAKGAQDKPGTGAKRADGAPARIASPVPDAPADGRLRVQVDSNAIVLVDGEVKGAAGVDRPLDLTGLRRGTHSIEARAYGFRGYAGRVEVAGAEPVLVHIELEPTPERVEDRLRLTSIDRQVITEQLSRLGYPCQLTRLQFGQDFRRVLAEFQRLGGLPATGFLTAETRVLIEQRIEERNREQQAAARRAFQRDAVTPPPPSGRYLQFPERVKDEGLRWMDAAPP